jgi:hypothetical protein
MTHPATSRGGDGGRGETPPDMPGWVKVAALVVLVMAVVLVVIMFVVGGDHGPRLHTGAAEPIGAFTSMVG